MQIKELPLIMSVIYPKIVYLSIYFIRDATP